MSDRIGCGLIIVIVIMAIAGHWIASNEKKDVYIKLPNGRTAMYTVKASEIGHENWGKTTTIWLPNWEGQIAVSTENVTIVTHKE